MLQRRSQPFHLMSRMASLFALSGRRAWARHGHEHTPVLDRGPLVSPSAGEIPIDARLVDGPRGDRAALFQDDAVFPWFTVERNVGNPPESAGWSSERRERATADALEFVGLANYRRFLPHPGSGPARRELVPAWRRKVSWLGRLEASPNRKAGGMNDTGRMGDIGRPAGRRAKRLSAPSAAFERPMPSSGCEDPRVS